MKCCAHGADLLLKDVGKLDFFADILKRINSIVKFVKNHHGTNAIYGSHTDLRLVTPCATRFATYVIVAMRMLKASFVSSQSEDAGIFISVFRTF